MPFPTLTHLSSIFPKSISPSPTKAQSPARGKSSTKCSSWRPDGLSSHRCACRYRSLDRFQPPNLLDCRCPARSGVRSSGVATSLASKAPKKKDQTMRTSTRCSSRTTRVEEEHHLSQSHPCLSSRAARCPLPGWGRRLMRLGSLSLSLPTLP